jgi:uncharacterized protein (TIGR02117 family)
MSDAPQTPGPTSVWRRIRYVMRQCVLLALAIALLYGLILLIGLTPINNDFAASPEGVEVTVISSSVHSDLVLPLRHELFNWEEHFPRECFTGDTTAATHVAIGWGDKGFYINTPTWDDLTMSTAANALLLPSDCCVHVAFTQEPQPGGHSRSVRISNEQYARLCEHVLSSFQRDTDGGC